MLIIILIILFFVLLYVRSFRFKPKFSANIHIFFGLPGSGKTTTATMLCKYYQKKGIKVFTNMREVQDVPYFDAQWLGQYMLGGSDPTVYVLDEAAIEFNNRDFATMKKQTRNWIRLARHYNCCVYLFSQSASSMDLTWRSCAASYTLVKRGLFKSVRLIPIHVRIGINDNTKDICDEYFFDHPLIRIFTTKRVFAPKWWKYFDSWAAPVLPDVPEQKVNKSLPVSKSGPVASSPGPQAIQNPPAAVSESVAGSS